MRVRLFLLSVAGALIFIPACMGYRELRTDWETYEPPLLYREYAKPARTSKVPDLDKGEMEYETQAKVLEEKKRKWEEVLKTPMLENGFYRPDPSRMKALLPAAQEPSLAKEILAHRLTLEELETLVLLRNPGVKAAERNLRASIEAYSQVSNLDEILRQYSPFTKEQMTGIGMMAGEEESMEMKFPFPGVLALKGEIVTQEVKASRERMAIALRMAITQIRMAYWNLFYTIRAREITANMLNLLIHLESIAKTRYETGNTSFQDLIRLMIEKTKMEEELKTIGEEQVNWKAKILELLDLPPDTKLGFLVAADPPAEVPALDGLYSVALEKRQELREMRAMIGKMERMIEMAETMVYPPYSLSISLFQNETIVQTGTMRMKEPFPLKPTASTDGGRPRMPWYGVNDAYLRETKQKLAALRMDLKRLEVETMFKVREAWYRLDRARREELLYAERLVNLSQAALEASTRAYETGKIAFVDVIMSHIDWFNDHLALEMRRKGLGIARAELEEVLGGPWK